MLGKSATLLRLHSSMMVFIANQLNFRYGVSSSCIEINLACYNNLAIYVKK